MTHAGNCLDEITHEEQVPGEHGAEGNDEIDLIRTIGERLLRFRQDRIPVCTSVREVHDGCHRDTGAVEASEGLRNELREHAHGRGPHAEAIVERTVAEGVDALRCVVVVEAREV